MQFNSTEEIDDADYILLKLYDDSFKAVQKNKDNSFHLFLLKY